MTRTRPRHRPPFDRHSALARAQASEDPWMVSLGYSIDAVWRHRDIFITGRDEIVEFLIYEWHDESGQWWRSYGDELWEFEPRREGSINDVRITDAQRRIFGRAPTGAWRRLPAAVS